MKTRTVYRQAIQRTFADLYSVPADAIDVAWTGDGESITVRCAGKTFTRQTDSAFDEFISDDDDPVTVTLTDDERDQLASDVP
jgi:hypothetical protein